MLNIDRSTVIHVTQKIKHACHQWLSDSLRVHRIRFRSGLCPGPHSGSLKRSPDPLVGLRGPTSKGKEERGVKEKKGQEGDRVGGREVTERREEEKMGTGGTAPPPFANSWIRPW